MLGLIPRGLKCDSGWEDIKRGEVDEEGGKGKPNKLKRIINDQLTLSLLNLMGFFN